jgi:release factor glutamine methyltransferase
VTVRDALRAAEERLAAAGLETPRADAEWLVAHVLGVGRAQIHAAGTVDTNALESLLSRRAGREPLAYVLGEWGFRRLTLKTDSRALVPRPETEIVVERALALIADRSEPRVLDVGVGSGAIALAIADEHPGAHVLGVDSSPAALELARENATRLGLEVELREGGSEVAAEGWDLVVSNPPYVGQGTMSALEPELAWEPREALLEAGLHEEIARSAVTRWLVFEVGDGQAESVSDVLQRLEYADVRITPDVSGRARVVEGRRA